MHMRGATPGTAARRGRNSVAVTGINYTPGLTALQTAMQSTIYSSGDGVHVTATQRASSSAVEDARLERERARAQMQRELDEVFRVPDAVRKEFPHSKIVGSYLIGRTLGEGAFAKVRLALHHPSGQQVAVKVVSKEKVKQDAYMAKHFRCARVAGGSRATVYETRLHRIASLRLSLQARVEAAADAGAPEHCARLRGARDGALPVLRAGAL